MGMQNGSSTATRRSRKALLVLAVSLVLGVAALGLIALDTRVPGGYSTGFPLPWSSPVTGCPNPNPFNGCGYSTSLPAVFLDYVVWVAVIFGLLLVVAGGLRGRPSGN